MTNALLITQTHNLWKKDGSASVQPGHVLKLPDLHIMKSNTDCNKNPYSLHNITELILIRPVK